MSASPSSCTPSAARHWAKPCCRAMWPGFWIWEPPGGILHEVNEKKVMAMKKKLWTVMGTLDGSRVFLYVT